eukprot:12579019-Alexandrium_andersonii.AAC.1
MEATVLRDLGSAAQAAAGRLRDQGPPGGPSGFPCLCFDALLEHTWGAWRQAQERQAEEAA